MKMLWERYLYKEILKTTGLFLACFFFLFVALDYSVHMQAFLRGNHLGLIEIATYYSFQFIRRCDLLFPLALLVATIKILRNMSERHELLALQVAGLPLKRLMRPFLLTATLTTFCNFAIAEFLLPISLGFSTDFKTQHLKNLPRQEQSERVRILELKDGSRLTFQNFDKTNTLFHDLFWIRSMDDIWRIKTLKLDREHPQDPPIGSYVDHIKRGLDGGLHKVASYPSLRMESLKATSYQLKKEVLPIDHYSLSKLLKAIYSRSQEENSRQTQFLAEFAMKTSRPLLSFIAILAIAPFCLRYSRFAPALPLYACGIFSVIAAFVAIQAGGILIQNGALSAWFAIVAPLFVLTSWSTYQFAKL